VLAHLEVRARGLAAQLVRGRVEEFEPAEVRAGFLRRGLDGVPVRREQRYLAGVAELKRPRAGGDDALVVSFRQAQANGLRARLFPQAGKEIRGATSRRLGCRTVFSGGFRAGPRRRPG
jgi:hypothetical protein